VRSAWLRRSGCRRICRSKGRGLQLPRHRSRPTGSRIPSSVAGCSQIAHSGIGDITAVPLEKGIAGLADVIRASMQSSFGPTSLSTMT
jgi:hypothetical protein